MGLGNKASNNCVVDDNERLSSVNVVIHAYSVFLCMRITLIINNNFLL